MLIFAILACATDFDSDGHTTAEDCDDTNASVFPGGTEACDGLDNDCDGTIDEGVTTTWFDDRDGDGYGALDLPVEACQPPAGFLTNSDDCDDTDAATSPAADEVCDGIDNDCDGFSDEDPIDPAVWHADADGDGYGDLDTTTTTLSCDQPAGHVSGSDDCDDTDAAISPAAAEVCDGLDNNCDGFIDEDEATDAASWWVDLDGDGHGDPDRLSLACAAPSGSVGNDDDCDDSDINTHSGAWELCDGVDNDCDSFTDESDAVDAATWYSDGDADGYGDINTAQVACFAPSGTTSNSDDCDDADRDINPDEIEVCDGLDNDCDGTVDGSGASDAITWHADGDSDGYGGAVTTDACDQPTGYVADGTDCDDTDADVSPAASEVCNTIDDDCDGLTDDNDGSLDASTGSTFYADLDSDGYGDAGSTTQSCEVTARYADDNTDCDDTDADVSPAASEVCDSIDNDCDGDIDDNDSSLDASTGTTFYADTDADSYGDSGATTQTCDQPSGYVADATDCNDADVNQHPGADEYCNEEDDDCDGTTDESGAVDEATWYSDGDGDGYGDAATTTTACSAPSGTTSSSDDCDDSDNTINPGIAEVCSDSIDNNCDGDIDELCPIEHCGTISSDETWSADDLHLITCSVAVEGTSRPVLTIEDGVTVEVDPDASLSVGFNGYGSLEVEGKTLGVTLTSSQVSPAPGDWLGLVFGSADEGSTILGLTVEYGGANTYGGILIQGATPTITESTIQYSEGNGIYVITGGVLIQDSVVSDNDENGIYLINGTLESSRGPSFTGNTLTGNGGYPILLFANDVGQLDVSSSFTGNGDDLIFIFGDTISEDADWQMLDADYYVDDDINVEGTASPVLTLAAGTTVLMEDAYIRIAWNSSGSIQATGTSSAPVTFTSAQSSPAAGDWGGIQMGYYCDTRSTALDYIDVAYGGSSGTGNLYFYYCNGSVTNSTITDSSDYGIVTYNATPTLSGNTYSNNTSGDTN